MENPRGLGPAGDALRALLGDRFDTGTAVREHHGRDESSLAAAPPDAVAFPETTEEVAAALKICNEQRVPVIPFGAGTSLEGHVLAPSGGISLDLTGMNEIVAVRVDDMDVTVQAGVTRSTLNDRLARDGLFFPVDPGADATLGGMAATGASGTTTVRYGAMRENVLSLEVVLADGRVIETARRSRKSSAGYDLTRLMVGSEGTLGVITGVTLRAYGIPEAISGAICRFPDVANAIRAATSVLQLGVPVARIELMDDLAIRASNSYSGLDYPVAPYLMFEFHGSHEGVAEQTRNAAEIVAEHGAVDYRSAIDPRERAQLWRARHDSFYASLALRPGTRALTTDVCVPISQLAACIEATRQDITELSLTATMVGHVGDGNFHVVALIDPDAQDELDAAEQMNHRLVERALAMDGTCTGEHGIGLRKIPFLQRELPGGIEVMRAIKRTLDPNNILNPGKVLELG
ncbi:MAG TPA: FAD-linked oxidase C-terminal domain-containing protein [Actinomycetota bacterium]|nr:FAD-linked oxidase C-terminal domain-containing protein [Actinomycetota bacterium]